MAYSFSKRYFERYLFERYLEVHKPMLAKGTGSIKPSVKNGVHFCFYDVGLWKQKMMEDRGGTY